MHVIGSYAIWNNVNVKSGGQDNSTNITEIPIEYDVIVC